MFHFSNKQHTLRFGIDVFCLLACYMAAAAVIKHRCFFITSVYDVIFEFVLIICWYYASKVSRLYSRNKGSILIELLKTLSCLVIQGGVLTFIYFITERPVFLPAFSGAYLAMMGVIITVQKVFVNSVRRLKTESKELTNVLIVGGGRLGMQFYDYAKSNPGSGYNVVGVLADKKPSSNIHDDYLGKVDMLADLFTGDLPINEVVVALPDSEVKSLKQVMLMSKNQAVHVKYLPDYSHIVSPGFTMQTVGDMLMVNPRPEPLEALHFRAVKRLFDICFSLLVLLLLCSWLFPIIAVMIRIGSKGPVFFKQLRAGKNTVPFYCYKFRSMYLNDKAHLEKAIKDDPRITLIGKILRKTNIDELPQFINVLKGDMSVVGPRPHMVSQNGIYSRIISQYLVRQLIKPGVTGWAQVSGYRGEIKTPADMQTRIEHDVWYLEHWSFSLDIKIIFLTVWNMIKGDEHAY